MKRLEDALPPSISFDGTIETLWSQIEEVFDAHIDDNGDILDTSVELECDFLFMWKLSGGLARALASDYEDSDAAHRAMYRGMCFGLQVIKEVKSGPLEKFELSSLFEDNTVPPEIGILNQTSQYLEDREHVDDLIGRYLPQIDPSFRYHHYSETGAALMVMLSERQQAKDILEAEANSLTPDELINPS